MYFPQVCPKCGRDGYPRYNSEMLFYDEYLERKRKVQSLIDSNKSVDGWLVQRFGEYECRCGRTWKSAWTWVIEYILPERVCFCMIY